MIWPFETLTPMKYGAILCDPPWAYVMRSEKGHAKSPEAHYGTMSPEELAALPVGQLAGPDCLIFMWSTWPHLKIAQHLLEDWGFAYITGGSWNKRGRSGKAMVGTGYFLRSSCEPYLVGKIGRPSPGSRSVTNLIDAAEIPDTIEALRREHSRKPAEMREMIERLLPRAYCCELFAREPWPGHDVWGNETTKFAEGTP
ncbi:MT-A70 family methyltransferase [Rhodobacter capsulatus]|uniref:MT-A70 family methyltransferase n=1 Tax=Rhodobacter capsulatus TaxID=1061 RepID=UPI0003D38B94|nr:MT-A70 family methyltransferase [Rhodobacter capsulatus]ETD85766.1 S-adenosylmethionine-binding protein [Rhodobacter capsulatus YW1]